MCSLFWHKKVDFKAKINSFLTFMLIKILVQTPKYLHLFLKFSKANSKNCRKFPQNKKVQIHLSFLILGIYNFACKDFWILCHIVSRDTSYHCDNMQYDVSNTLYFFHILGIILLLFSFSDYIFCTKDYVCKIHKVFGIEEFHNPVLSVQNLD